MKNINVIIDLLYKEINNYHSFYNGANLVGGELSLSLLNLILGKALNNTSLIEKSLIHFENLYTEDTIFELINNQNYSFINGLSGLVWMYQYFVLEDLIESDDEFLDEMDSIIFNHITQSNYSYDLFYGLIGFSNYFFLRNEYNGSTHFLKAITDILLKTKIQNTYYSEISNNPFNDINLGYAHGLPSILNFYIKIYKLLPSKEIKDECYKISKTILSFKKDEDGEKSLFPYRFNYISELDYNTRLAWCYGDLGIVLSLMNFSTSFDEKEIKIECINILNNIKNLSIEQKLSLGVQDKCFCHGVSGIMIIYYKLIHEFGYNSTIEFDFWLKKLTNFKTIEDFYTSHYDNREYKNIMKPDLGVIEGYIGIILSLCYLYDDKSKWTQIFFI